MTRPPSTFLTRRERIAGALAGLVLGDALGAPVENLDATEISRLCPNGLSGLLPWPNERKKTGQVTDDSEMALLVTRSLIVRGFPDFDDLAYRLGEWGKNRSDLGPSTSRALDALRRNVRWTESGSDDLPSSGCLPRCAPLSFLLSGQDLIDKSICFCQMTHLHPLAVASVVFLNQIIEQLVNSAYPPVDLVFILTSLQTQQDDTIKKIWSGQEQHIGATNVLVEAIHSLMQSKNPRQALSTAVLAGGDTDTRGAVAGLLAGAYWGAATLPRTWINDCPTAQEALALGYQLADLNK
jgi:ADP-ribosyl-[dinitrogen reductase] hydrolase